MMAYQVCHIILGPNSTEHDKQKMYSLSSKTLQPAQVVPNKVIHDKLQEIHKFVFQVTYSLSLIQVMSKLEENYMKFN